MVNTQSLPLCKKCNAPFDERIKRHRAVKFFFFFLPLKRYHCWSCNSRQYVWDKTKKSRKKASAAINCEAVAGPNLYPANVNALS